VTERLRTRQVWFITAVVADYEAKCLTGTPITLTADIGYIVNHVAFNPSTLHAVCTWRIRVAPGQRIALTLYDFGRHRSRPTTTAAGGSDAKAAAQRSSPRASSANVCRKYAVVREVGKIYKLFMSYSGVARILSQYNG